MLAKIVLFLFVFSFLFKTDHSFDQDLGRHLKLGEIIVKTQQIPQTNLFSYTNPNFPFINTHWLFEVWVFLTSQVLGLEILLIIKIAVFLTSIWLILKTIPKENRILLLPVGFIFLHVLRERTELRPEIFSFLFTAITYFILEKFQKSATKLVFLLPIIQLLWVNTHIYFFVGMILQVIYLIHLGYLYLRFHLEGGKLKLLAGIFILSILASLINPYGLTGLLYPLNVTKNYGYTIVENQTMFLLESINFTDPNFLYVKISLVIIALSLIVLLFRKKFEVKNILLVSFGAGLALMNVRSFPYLVFLSLPAVLQNFGRLKLNFATQALVITSGIFLVWESINYLNGNYYLTQDYTAQPKLEFIQSGKNALDFVISNNLPQPIYNNFDIGSYIIYRGYPKYQVFVDGRPESYPQEFFQQTYIPSQADYAKFKQLETRYGFQTIIFSITDQTPWGKAFLTSVVKDKDWQIIYLDDFMIILVKNDALSSLGQTLKYTPLDLAKLDPNNYTFSSYLSYLRLSLFLIQTGNVEAAQKFLQAGNNFLDLRKK